MIDKKIVRDELKVIQNQNNGLLDPIKVVEYAENPETALHNKFEWDDTLAAQKHRIWQARQIIKLEFSVISKDSDGTVREATEGDMYQSTGSEKKIEFICTRSFVSLPEDRRPDEGPKGYRSIIDVLSNEELRDKLLEQAKFEMAIFKQKYILLSGLSKVFKAMDDVLKSPKPEQEINIQKKRRLTGVSV